MKLKVFFIIFESLYVGEIQRLVSTSFGRNSIRFSSKVVRPLPVADEVVDEVVDNLANYQEYEYDVYFLQCHIFTVIHFMNGEGDYWITSLLIM